MPRTDFKAFDLQVAGAIDIGRPVKTPDLSGDVHELFQNWQKVDARTLAALRPSMQLASNLVRVGMPYIASFLPAAKKDFWRRDRRNPWPKEIPLNLNPTQEEISEAVHDLKVLAKDLTWHSSGLIYPRYGYLGVTRMISWGDWWEETLMDDVSAADKILQGMGVKRRPLFLGIMSEYVTALETSDPHSERHIRATFMAAITMAHEVGHAIFLNDFRAFHRDREPHVGDDCEAELGFSFIAWIFGGFHPQYSPGDVEFVNTLTWEPQYTLSMGKRPLDKTFTSLSIAYLERVLSQDFWDSLGPADQPQYTERARKELRPDIEGKRSRVAVATRPNWTWSHLHDRPIWNNDRCFRMKGFTVKDRVVGPTPEEIQVEYDLTKDEPRNVDYRGMTKEGRRELYHNIKIRTEDSEDDDSEGGLDDPRKEVQPVKAPEPLGPQQPQAPQMPKETKLKYGEEKDDASRPVRRLGPQKGTVEQMSRELLMRGAEIDGLVTGPSLEAHKRPRLGSDIMDDIDDYETVIDLTKDAEDEKKGGMKTQGTPSGVKRRRVGDGRRPQPPPSHMKDIYDLIVLCNDGDGDAYYDEE